ncbi:MAG: hypothetical protein ACRCV9_13515 [Burkholderiaceae bacterium]
MNTMQISGITYIVVGSTVLERGRTEIKLRRQKGRRFYFAVVYENGSVSEVV